MPSRHQGIAEDLRHQITTGRIKPGERLASEAGLADRYKVSTVTLRRALAMLQGAGLVEKIHGREELRSSSAPQDPLHRGMGGWTRGPPLKRPCVSPFAPTRFRHKGT